MLLIPVGVRERDRLLVAIGIFASVVIVLRLLSQLVPSATQIWLIIGLILILVAHRYLRKGDQLLGISAALVLALVLLR